MLFKFKIHIFYILTVIYIILSLILGTLLSNGLIIFLGWNIFLATLVFLVSQMIHFQYQKKSKNMGLFIVLLLIYVLLFPNTIYVLTDFIHFQNYNFFSSYPNVYTLQSEDWFVFMHIVIGALYATKLGMSSIKNIQVIFKRYNKKFFYAALSCLFMLSSVGIYIGRFLRFNSWDVFKTLAILKDLLSQGLFLVIFIAILFIIHWVSYFIFLTDEKFEYNNNS